MVTLLPCVEPDNLLLTPWTFLWTINPRASCGKNPCSYPQKWGGILVIFLSCTTTLPTLNLCIFLACSTSWDNDLKLPFINHRAGPPVLMGGTVWVTTPGNKPAVIFNSPGLCRLSSGYNSLSAGLFPAWNILPCWLGFPLLGSWSWFHEVGHITISTKRRKYSLLFLLVILSSFSALCHSSTGSLSWENGLGGHLDSIPSF